MNFTKMKDKIMEIRKQVDIIKNALEDKKGYDLKILNIEGISTLADYFILATGSNRNQIQAMVDNVSEELAKEKIYAKSTEGYENANWILVDYGDIMLHVFNPESREFYNLDRLWRDAKEE